MILGILREKKMAELCPTAVWKAELERESPGYLAEISKQCVQGVAWFLPAAYRKM